MRPAQVCVARLRESGGHLRQLVGEDLLKVELTLASVLEDEDREWMSVNAISCQCVLAVCCLRALQPMITSQHAMSSSDMRENPYLVPSSNAWPLSAFSGIAFCAKTLLVFEVDRRARSFLRLSSTRMVPILEHFALTSASVVSGFSSAIQVSRKSGQTK
jgi:hypothetical protein